MKAVSKDLGGFTKEEAREMDAALDAAYEEDNLTKGVEPEDGAESLEKSAAGSSAAGWGSSDGSQKLP